MASVGKALDLLKKLPRVTLANLKPLPGARHKRRVRGRGQHGGKNSGRGSRGQGKHNTLPRMGYEGGNTPFYLIVPKEPYYQGHHVRKQYPPLSLLQLQRLIDLGRIDTTQPIDLTVLCNTKVLTVDHRQRHYGVNLTEEGVDIFRAQVNIEVQWTSELCVAAVEKSGGNITTKFYDLQSVEAMSNPEAFFKRGIPIPRCKLPSPDILDYYTSAKNRGYLAIPEEVQEARLELAQKYGYILPNIEGNPLHDMLMKRKSPLQIWYGLSPGWVVNMRNKSILKSKGQDLEDYYSSV